MRFEPHLVAKLQWGRATEGPERAKEKKGKRREVKASMGPGHGGPGETEISES